MDLYDLYMPRLWTIPFKAEKAVNYKVHFLCPFSRSCLCYRRTHRFFLIYWRLWTPGPLLTVEIALGEWTFNTCYLGLSQGCWVPLWRKALLITFSCWLKWNGHAQKLKLLASQEFSAALFQFETVNWSMKCPWSFENLCLGLFLCVAALELF